MKVSVLITAYNHEKFIEQAINGILMQTVNFDYEIVIGEDCSTDHTRDLVIAIKERYPDKIRLVLSTKNVGENKNIAQTLPACQGQYVAWMDGDDYWTSPHKLQKQVDFLDSHPECSICFHNVTVFYEDGSKEAHSYCPEDQKEFSTIEDLLVRNFIPTSSTMFRQGPFGEFPDWYYSLKFGDWPLLIFCAEQGKIGYINEIMGVYRIHPGGAWFMMVRNWHERNKAVIEFYDNINIYLRFKYKRIIDRISSGLCCEVAVVCENMGDLATARTYAKRCLNEHFLANPKLFKILLKLYAPNLFKLLKPLKRATYSVIRKKP